MSCRHANPAGYAFCGTCGEPLPHSRCRCGFICGQQDVFCGRCGATLGEEVTARGDLPAVSADARYDLEALAGIALQEAERSAAAKVKVTQDDIRKLLARKRKKS